VFEQFTSTAETSAAVRGAFLRDKGVLHIREFPGTTLRSFLNRLCYVEKKRILSGSKAGRRPSISDRWFISAFDMRSKNDLHSSRGNVSS
jgi:hypothetical protein